LLKRGVLSLETAIVVRIREGNGAKTLLE
jgi:hypothetical protein